MYSGYVEFLEQKILFCIFIKNIFRSLFVLNHRDEGDMSGTGGVETGV
jgi:hypothetical protein